MSEVPTVTNFDLLMWAVDVSGAIIFVAALNAALSLLFNFVRAAVRVIRAWL
jgi:hypothetical protein